MARDIPFVLVTGHDAEVPLLMRSPPAETPSI